MPRFASYWLRACNVFVYSMLLSYPCLQLQRKKKAKEKKREKKKQKRSKEPWVLVQEGK